LIPLAASNMELPVDFKYRMAEQLKDDYSHFIEALDTTPPVSIRFNPNKKATAAATVVAEKVAWEDNGIYLPERPIFTLDPAFHAGAYYVQEASSMLIASALKQKIDFNTPLKILDLCAAPGGKSTLLASLMNEKSILLSNEVIKNRVTILKENMLKWGNPNVMTSNHEAAEMSDLEHFFDVILIDAPCSGEGLFRKDENATREWSLENVQLCSSRQRRIIADALALLKENGVLLYSTCTYNHEENSKNIAWITQNFGCQSEKLVLPAAWGITEIQNANTFGYQCYPHKVRGEGFFFSLLTKKEHQLLEKNIVNNKKNEYETLSQKDALLLENWINQEYKCSFYKKGNGKIVAVPNEILAESLMIERALRRVSFGIEIGEFKGKDFIPSHDLALSYLIHPNIQAVELSKEEALLFLKKELQNIETDLKNWTLARFQGLNLGWMKVLPNRINNYLPVEFRIRMDLSCFF
jgi:16S rRNA C967 or C1407 C5-methylase (RsmB/RsmF family)/NOL1/NOP2/fmu family ribosome biogenesis protein